LAVVAALAFVADGALGADHHLGAAPASGGHHHMHAHGHSHGHVHAHSHTAASDHRHINGDVVEAIDLGAADGSSVPASGSDAYCCFCACCAAIVLPSLNAQAAPVVLLRTLAIAYRGHSDGVVPDGLRRPPRPTAIT
jgi:hypothetical protein